MVEHITLRKMFNQVEQILPTLSRVEDVRSIAKMVESLLHEHGDVEEHMLLVTLDHSLEHVKQLQHMSQEHGEIDHRLTRACTATDLCAGCKDLKAAMDFSRKHFDNEERKIFPVIQQQLTHNSLLALGEAWFLNQMGH